MQNTQEPAIATTSGSHIPANDKQKRRRGFYVVLYFAAVVLLFFRAPLLFAPHYHIPYDLEGYHYPLSDLIAWSLREFHQLPSWNPFSYMGQPFYGNVQAAIFYPPTLLVAVGGNLLFGRLPFYLLELELVLHVFVAGLGTYLLVRLLRLSVASSLAGGTIYSLGAFFASQTQHLGVISCAAWLPWFIAGLSRLEQRRDFKSVAIASVALALMILPGFPAGYLPVFIFGPLFFGFWMWHRHPRFELRFHLRPALLFAGTVLLAMMLSAVSWLPAYEIGKLSVATERPIVQALYGIYPKAISSFFWPNLFGQLESGFEGRENPTFLHLYQGIPALLLVAGGAFSLLHSRKAHAFITASVLALLWMFGTLTFVAELMYLIYPSFVRRGIYPHYVLAYFSLSFAVLAALALNGYETQERPRLFSSKICWGAASLATLIAVLFSGIGSLTPMAARTATASTTLFWVAAVLALCGLLVGRQDAPEESSRRYVPLALCAVIAIDLITVGSSNVMNTTFGKRPDIPPALHFIKEKLGPLPLYRVDTTGMSSGWQTQVPEWRLPSANGMDPLLLLDTLTYRAPFSSVSGRQFSITSFQSPLLDLAGIRYIVTPQKEIAGATLVYRGDANVFENPRAFPRFFLVGSVAPAPDVPTAVRLIQRREVDPARVAVVASADQARFPGLSGAADSSGLGDVQLLAYSPNEIRVQVNAFRPAVLVATETFWKDWRATLDGRPQLVTRADGLFRAVAVPAGTHQISMFMVPTKLYAGAAISVLGILLVLLLIWLTPRSRDFGIPDHDFP